MYVVNTGQILQNLLTFDKLDFEDIEIHAYVHLLVEDVVAVFNSKDFDNAYERAGHFTTVLGNNNAVETIYLETLNDIRSYTRKAGWDKRCHIRIDERQVKDSRGMINQVFLVMDLDATMDAIYDPFTPDQSAGEIISDNPTQDELDQVLEGKSVRS